MNIPDYLDSPVLEKRGDDYYWSDNWSNIMQQLIQTLRDNASDEGLVAPTQDATNIATIQNNTVIVGNNTIYTCGFGRILYDLTNDLPKISVKVAGVPLFKTIVTI